MLGLARPVQGKATSGRRSAPPVANNGVTGRFHSARLAYTCLQSGLSDVVILTESA